MKEQGSSPPEAADGASAGAGLRQREGSPGTGLAQAGEAGERAPTPEPRFSGTVVMRQMSTKTRVST